jgi:hypothetical protein
MTRDSYDEFGLFHENIAEFDLDVAVVPPIGRVEIGRFRDRRGRSRAR